MVLREKGGFDQRDLAQQIDQAISSNLPSHIRDAIDAVRHVGNFAAHPQKNSAGMIVDVKPGEAEWLLDTIESLLDFYIVEPERLNAKRSALNEKLATIGKPPLK